MSITSDNIFLIHKSWRKNLDSFFNTLQTESFSGDLSAVWRALHRRELEANARSRDAALARAAGEATVLELPPIKRTWISQPDRDWLLNQLNKEQWAVWETLQTWAGTLDTFNICYEA